MMRRRSVASSKYHLCPRYSVGDTVTASCLSPASVPASSLTWYINSDTADPGTVAGPREMELLAQVRR